LMACETMMKQQAKFCKYRISYFAKISKFFLKSGLFPCQSRIYQFNSFLICACAFFHVVAGAFHTMWQAMYKDSSKLS
jgi:hypothetical protein